MHICIPYKKDKFAGQSPAATVISQPEGCGYINRTKSGGRECIYAFPTINMYSQTGGRRIQEERSMTVPYKLKIEKDHKSRESKRRP